MASGESSYAQAWLDEIRKDVETSGSTANKETEDRLDSKQRFSKLSSGMNEEQKKILKEQMNDPVMKTAKKEFLQREAELKQNVIEKERIPEHSKIKEIFELTSAKERLELDYKLIENAFKQSGNINVYPDGKTGLSLDRVKQINATDPETNTKGEACWNTFRMHKPTPDILCKAIEREPTAFEKTKMKMGAEVDLKTNEVLVVISLNNGTNENENTVITMVGRHQNGQLIFDSQNRDGLYRVQSEKDYKDLIERSSYGKLTPDQRVASGEITIDEYKKIYRNDGKKLDAYWKAWDKKIAEVPDPRDINAGKEYARRAEVVQSRKELLEGLEGKYTRALQEWQAVGKERIKGVEVMVKAIESKNREVMTSSDVLGLVSMIKAGKFIRGSEALNSYLASLAKNLDMKVEDFEKLVQLVLGKPLR